MSYQEQPSAILPEEVWRIVLGKLQNPEDLFTCSKVSCIWNDILSSTKVEWMFFQILPAIFPYLSQNDLLSCRKTCKLWRRSVDHFLENHNDHHKKRFEQGSAEWNSTKHFNTTIPCFNFLNGSALMTENLRLKLTTTQPALHSNQNPFVGRYVKIKLINNDKRMKFLREFGKHFWFATLHLVSWPHQMPDLLEESILLFPNVKKLELHVRILEDDLSTDNTYEDDQSRNLQILREHLDTVHLRFPKPLETLQVYGFPAGYTHCIQSKVLEAIAVNRQIKNIFLEHSVEIDSTPRFPSSLENLDLQTQCMKSLEGVLDIMQASTVSLQKLRLSFEKVEVNFARLTEILNILGKQLTVLTLRFSFCYVIKDESKWSRLAGLSKLRMPRLTVLELEMVEGISYNFLLSLAPSLTDLRLHFRHEMLMKIRPELMKREKTSIQETLRTFWEKGLICSNVIYSCNVWRLLPNLRNWRVEFEHPNKQRYVFTREGYQLLMKMTALN